MPVIAVAAFAAGAYWGSGAVGWRLGPRRPRLFAGTAFAAKSRRRDGWHVVTLSEGRGQGKHAMPSDESRA